MTIFQCQEQVAHVFRSKSDVVRKGYLKNLRKCHDSSSCTSLLATFVSMSAYQNLILNHIKILNEKVNLFLLTLYTQFLILLYLLKCFNIDQPRKTQDKNKKPKTALVWSPFYFSVPKITLYELGGALALHSILLQPKEGHRTNLISKSEVMMAAKGSSASEVYSL